MLKILQARLQQYVNRELPDVQAGFRKGRGTRDQTANIRWIIEKAREFQKNIYFCFIAYAKAYDCVNCNQFPHSHTFDNFVLLYSVYIALSCNILSLVILNVHFLCSLS